MSTRSTSTTTRGRASLSPSPSPSPESALEILYNTAVQSFVRRDHVKTQASLDRLLFQLRSSTSPRTEFEWYRLDEKIQTGPDDTEWVIKTLKLVISSHASLYTDPPQNTSGLSQDTRKLLPPTSPEVLLKHLQHLCEETYFPTSANASASAPRILPPPLISTLLLASLKLRPAEPALTFAHKLAEDWLSLLPDSFILHISPGNGNDSSTSAEGKKRVESAREGYLKVVELFVGEVLAREGEWEMARGFLDGEVVMSSKRKETLFRHLRAMQSKPRSTTSSPSSSGILPSPTTSGYLPPSSPSPTPAAATGPDADGNPHSGSQGRRSRSGTSNTSSRSSSSEATARPTTSAIAKGFSKVTAAAGAGLTGDKGKGKGKERIQAIQDNERDKDTISDSTDSHSTFALPKRIFVNPFNPQSQSSPNNRHSPTPGRRQPASLHWLDLIPLSIRARLTSPYVLSTILPVPIILILIVLGIRRRIRRRRTAVSPEVGLAATATAMAATRAVDDVRDRLRQARGGRGLIAWFVWYLRWWLDKFKGVWKLGTTITWM